MSVSLGIVMDPIASITVRKDTSFAMLLAAQARGWELHYMEQGDLWLRDGQVLASTRRLRVRDDPGGWYELAAAQECPLAKLDVVLMRKDPPFDLEFIYSTYLLELAAHAGTLIINKSASLRDANEKAFTAWFPQCCPPTLVTRQRERAKTFLEEQGDIVVKPMDGMGGQSIFRIREGDPNTNVILETLTAFDTRTMMAQKFLPEYLEGDKRILLIDGNPVPYALARIPAAGEARANLATGGTGKGVELTARDRW
ncbi:MAG: glutathione synthase, partial [Gammaproteobacteria bacterium]